MDEIQPFSVLVATNVPADDAEALRLGLQSAAEVREMSNKAIDWAMVLLVVGGIGTAFSTIKSGIELGEKVVGWVRAMRQRGTPPDVRLERPGQPGLNLEQASEEEILAWLLQHPSE